MSSRKQQVRILSAIADETRLGILQLLAEKPSLCVCDITSAFQVGQPTISHHLRILRDADLVRSEKRGVWVYYSLNRAAFKKVLIDLLSYV